MMTLRVPQGCILRSSLFLLYFNDLTDDVTCHIVIYADDTLDVIMYLICCNN